MVDTAHLARIDAIVAAHRALFLAATWAGHDGEAIWHADTVQRINVMRDRMQARHLAPA